jgi:hypothetical protein
MFFSLHGLLDESMYTGMAATRTTHEPNTAVSFLLSPRSLISPNRISKPRLSQLRHHSLRNTTPPASHDRQPTPAHHVPNGTIFSNGDTSQDHYKCSAPGCFNKVFRRASELRRHHKTKHAAVGMKPLFWCPVEGCKRSKAGGESFPRKDKMHDHLERVHASIVGT